MLLLSCANFAGNPKETTWESLSEVMEYKYQGPTARCCDGTYSYSQNHQGTCSHHRGVCEWYR